MIFNWTILANIISFITALTAIIALILETRRSRISQQTEVLLSLTDKMNSPEIRLLRSISAKKLLTHDEQNYEIIEVLDFLDTVAYLLNIKAVNKTLVYREFSWWLIRYYLCAYSVIEEDRKLDPLSWTTLEKIALQMKRKEEGDGYSPELYSAFALQEFLKKEAKIYKIKKQNS